MKPRARRIGALAMMVVAGQLVAAPARAEGPPTGKGGHHNQDELVLQATGSDARQECSQFAMNLSADAAKVRALVPSTFVFSRDAAGKAVLGYRVFECRSLRVGSAPPQRVVWSELGVRVLPPEGLPEAHVDQHVDGHDYYMLAFRTTNPRLAWTLERMGLAPDGQPGLLAQSLSYGVERLPSPPDALGDATASDVAGPVALSADEAVPGGSYVTRLRSTAGLWYRKPIGPLDVREWFLRTDGRVISVFEHKERPTALIPSINLTVDAGTLIGRLVDRAPDADGRTRLSSSTDVYVQFDEVMTWQVRDMPTPIAPPAYDIVRQISSGGPR